MPRQREGGGGGVFLARINVTGSLLRRPFRLPLSSIPPLVQLVLIRLGSPWWLDGFLDESGIGVTNEVLALKRP